jgi:hypothetical protein
MVSRLQRIALHALASERGCAGPLHGPPPDAPAGILRLDVNERMRIPVHKLHQSSFELDLGIRLVRRTKRMMAVRRHAMQREDGKEEKKKQAVFHWVLS